MNLYRLAVSFVRFLFQPRCPRKTIALKHSGGESLTIRITGSDATQVDYVTKRIEHLFRATDASATTGHNSGPDTCAEDYATWKDLANSFQRAHRAFFTSSRTK